MRSGSVKLLVCALCCAAVPAGARAQSAPPPSPSAPPAAVQPDPDLSLQPSEPDFTLAALPTSLRLPRGKMAFRLTHRFSYAIDQGTAADFVQNFFGFDSHAEIGLEVRYGLASGTQFVVHRTSDRDIQMLGQHQFVQQGKTRAASIDLLVAVEGQDNFSTNFSGTVGAIVSRRFRAGAVYAEPMVVVHSDPLTGGPDTNSTLLGLGARVRLGRSTYLVAETAPRLAGYGPGAPHVSAGLEKRAGGHLFQLNISNDLGTTLRQIAAGGLTGNHWHIGFNLTRKFF